MKILSMQVIFADVCKLGPYINQNAIMQDLYKQIPYECRLDIQYEWLKMEISYLDEIYHSGYKWFLSAKEHLNYHSTMTNTKHTIKQILTDWVSNNIKYRYMTTELKWRYYQYMSVANSVIIKIYSKFMITFYSIVYYYFLNSY